MKILFLIFFITSQSGLWADGAIDKWLKLGVKNGVVDYAYFHSRKQVLSKTMAQMAKENLEGKSAAAVKAFWINAYNLGTLALILKHYPLKSIKDISRSERWLWKGWVFAGQTVSLDEIEHEILRPMGDPRIHFAINCASFSCPVLESRLFVADGLDERLDLATKRFLSDPRRGLKVVEEKSFLGWGEARKVVYVSKLFNWFGVDFVKKDSDILTYISRYVQPETLKVLKKLEASELKFLDYDWSLNGR